MSGIKIPSQRDVIDRRALAAAIAAQVEDEGAARARQRVVELLRQALAAGREELANRLAEHPSAGHEITAGHAFLIDQIIRVMHDHAIEHLYPASNRTKGERLTIMAVGGYGRAEMAPHSDIDIGFLAGWKVTGWCEQVVESMLYSLWDMQLKVGHSSRSLDEMVRQAKADVTVRTALLEGRYVWGDTDLYDEATRRFRAEVQHDTARAFIAEKLAERELRHKRMGDSRYVVEPNVKEGKGGLRDLHTLFWIGKYAYNVREPAELVEAGLL